ncbi:Asp23/Gls24 family envelope stress response protein [Streptococcus pacificus]|uniref:Stress response regulator gls24 homolog n=1 Tax=Streptococcus pacificus TaxID=2740577 RepID=A0ABS0ZIC3_9STRE|nr:Asp23/Gls24 family envelope stress response protein [Streptococcus pacificus]MBJ8325751.1 Asp23/Gls24 family envelope stress response protein [Streptococcus pacificus]
MANEVKTAAVAETPEKVSSVRGELTFEEKVIEKIIGLAIASIDGLLAVDGGFFSNIKDKLVNTESVTDGVHVEVGTKQVAVDLNIIVEYQKHVPTVYRDIKAIIEKEVKEMTDLDVVEVNVKVVDIKTKEQYEADSVSLQDRVTGVANATGEMTSEQFDKIKSGVSGSLEKATESSEPRVV